LRKQMGRPDVLGSSASEEEPKTRRARDAA
jgi:hypothetical protein